MAVIRLDGKEGAPPHPPKRKKTCSKWDKEGTMAKKVKLAIMYLINQICGISKLFFGVSEYTPGLVEKMLHFYTIHTF